MAALNGPALDLRAGIDEDSLRRTCAAIAERLDGAGLQDRVRRGRQSFLAMSGVTGARPSGKSATNASFTKSGAPRM